MDKTDGSISHFARSADNLIRFQLIGDNKYLSELPPEICCSYFFQSCPAHGQIECCLTLLSLVSYLAPTREDIVRQIENLLIDHKLFFFCPDRSMPLLVSLLLLYTYYSDNFYALLL